jgi:hypothetical protein
MFGTLRITTPQTTRKSLKRTYKRRGSVARSVS